MEREATHFNRTWNTFQALTMVDFDGDGVAEILVAHGGDPYATPAVMTVILSTLNTQR